MNPVLNLSVVTELELFSSDVQLKPRSGLISEVFENFAPFTPGIKMLFG